MSANPNPLGVLQPVPGTPLNVTANYPGLINQPVNSMYFQVLPSNTGDVYIGIANMMDKTTGVGVIAVLRPPTANHLPDLAWQISGDPNPYVVGQYVVDCDDADDGIRADFQVW